MKIEQYKKIAILLIIIAIALGALGAHYLQNILTESEIKSIETGIRYQLFHAIAILILALNTKAFNSYIIKSLNIMIIGICFFSFSIYLLSIQRSIDISMDLLGPITPIGGLLLITSWVILFLSVKKID